MGRPRTPEAGCRIMRPQFTPTTELKHCCRASHAGERRLTCRHRPAQLSRSDRTLVSARAVAYTAKSGAKAPHSKKCPNINNLMIQLGELLFQALQFGKIVVYDIRLISVRLQIVLVIFFSAKESLEGHHLGHNLARIDFGRIELPDVRGRNPLLFLVGIENCRTVLGPVVRSLAV